jgi:hypothetical protein
MKIIPLTRGLQTLVDDEDFDQLNKHKWYAQRCKSGDNVRFYAARRDVVTRKIVLMHRQLLGLEKRSDHGDHKNGDSLNNQRYNLRPATHRQNLCNTGKRNQATTSKHKGVSFYRNTGEWESYVWVDGKKRRQGYFETEHEAALGYNFAALHHYGEFAMLNEVHV